jgi:sensor histidine kinase YesM
LVTALFYVTDWLIAGQISRFLLIYGLACAYLWGLGLPLIRGFHRQLVERELKLWQQASIHLLMAVIFGLAHAYAFSLFQQVLLAWFGYEITYQQALRSYGTYLFLPDVMFYAFAVVQYRAQLLDQQVQQRALQNVELQKEMVAMRLHQLHNQLQPHFLFNTLNGITGLIRAGEKRQATEMVVDLSDLLRRSLRLSDQTKHPLKDEIAFVRAYLDIESKRMADRLKVSIRVPEALMQQSVPVLLLQPLVENAIRHGIEPLPEGGELHLEAIAELEALTIRVHNSGVPLPENWTEGVGLSNLRQRLQYLYGEGHRLELSAEPNGTTVDIHLPLRSEKDLS